MSTSSIYPPNTEGTIHLLSLPRNRKILSVKGNCYLTLKSGSFELSPWNEMLEAAEIEVQCRDVIDFNKEPNGAELEERSPCFVSCMFFNLTSGEDGCRIELYYPAIEKKDWGIPGAQKVF